MKIEITGEPKEIAALVLEIQERQADEIHIGGKKITEALHEDSGRTAQTKETSKDCFDKKLEQMKNDVQIQMNYLLQCTIVREQYVLKLLEVLFEKLQIQKPEFEYGFGASIKDPDHPNDADRQRQ